MNSPCRRYRVQNYIMPAHVAGKSGSHLVFAIPPHSSLYRVQNYTKETWHNTLSRKSDILFMSLHRPSLSNRISLYHRVYRVEGFLSIRPNLGSLTPSPESECCPPLDKQCFSFSSSRPSTILLMWY